MKYYIEIISNKPKNDVNEIVAELGFINLVPIPKGGNMFSRFYVKLIGVFSILFKLKRNDILFLQYPMKKFYKISCILAKIKGAKVITLIHDLGSFRRHRLTPSKENKRLSKADYIIVHNQTMNDFLKQNGCSVPLGNLDIFDYLSPCNPVCKEKSSEIWTVLYAGGLGRWRNEFLYNIEPFMKNWNLFIYGRDFDLTYCGVLKHLFYKGFVDSDQFIANVDGHFGLVWDGQSLDECIGDWGEYLKINNPHKTSFYIRSGIPVIAWKSAAMAPFIEENKIGFCVNSLRDIDSVLQSLSKEEYLEMKTNAMNMCSRLGAGFYTKKAINKALSYFDNSKVLD